MSWAAGRRAIVIAILTALAIAIVAVILIATLYQSPTCTDTKQNGGETGVDCGGSCALLCSAEQKPADVLFARPLSPEPGRADVIAYVENPNPRSGVQNASYEVNLYGTDGILVATKKGTMDLAPGTTAPIYIPNLFSGYQPVARAFLSFDEASMRWMRYTPAEFPPKSAGYTLTDEATAPRVTATISNPGPVDLHDVKIVATVFGKDGNAIAASQTILPSIAATGQATAVFTWNAPFGASVARVEILPVLPLAPAP